MPSFDPSVISDIGGSGPDVAGSMAKGFQLKDLADQNQMNQLRMNTMKADAADDKKYKDILSKSDLSTPEGVSKAAEELTRNRMPQKGLELSKFAQQKASGEYDLVTKKLETYHAQISEIHDMLAPVLAKSDEIKDPNTKMAYIKGQLPLMLQQIQQSSVLDPQVKQTAIQKIQAAMQSPDAYNQFVQAEKESSQTRTLLKSNLDERKGNVEIRKDEAQIGEFEARAAKERADASGLQNGVITDDAADMAARRMLNGEKAGEVLANFGRGKQGPQNIAKVQNRFAALAKEQGLSSQDITNRMIEMKGVIKEEQTAGAISGKIRYAENEIKKIAPLVLEQSAKVPRGAFVPWNKLKLYGEAQLSNPELKKLQSYLNTLVNSYDVLGGRGGTDVEKRAHNRSLLDSADSPEALKAAVEAIEQEASLSGEAASESLRRTGAATPGAQGSAKPNDPLGIR